jgi:hypothetical protein
VRPELLDPRHVHGAAAPPVRDLNNRADKVACAMHLRPVALHDTVGLALLLRILVRAVLQPRMLDRSK